VERICARHGLAPTGEMQWCTSGASVRCTNTVFLIGNLAIKVFARPSPVWFRREVECLRVLSDVPAAKTPRLLASLLNAFDLFAFSLLSRFRDQRL
jgi:hypothetical protein